MTILFKAFSLFENFGEELLPSFGDPQSELWVPEGVDDRVHDRVEHALKDK